MVTFVGRLTVVMVVVVGTLWQCAVEEQQVGYQMQLEGYTWVKGSG